MNTVIFFNINYQNSKYVCLTDTYYRISHLPNSNSFRIMLIDNKKLKLKNGGIMNQTNLKSLDLRL